MKFESIRLQELYDCKCPPERPCSKKDCRNFRRKYSKTPLEETKPGLSEQVKTFVAAIVRHILHGLPTATPADEAERWTHCEPCEYRTVENLCAKCGCGTGQPGTSRLLDKKRWAKERCPIGKWEAVKGETVFSRGLRWLLELVRLKG